jgi:cytochrome c biogenesis protein ResB
MIRSSLKKVWHFLTRLKVAAVLMVILLLLVALGSCFPQIPLSVTADAERLARWETEVQARYGVLWGLLATLQVFGWFRSSIFLISLAFLAVATFVCTLDRWRAVWRRAFHSPPGFSGAIFDAAPHTARLVGALVTDWPSMVREPLERRGFRVLSQSEGDAVYLRGDRNRLAVMATLVTHLAVLALLLGVILSSGLGWREELAIGPDESIEVGHGSRLALRNDGFVIERYPDGSAADYRARVAVIEGNQVVTSGSVRVNQPLTYGGVGLFLRGYGETEGSYRVTLLAVRDPGYGLVIGAGFLLLLGLTVSFNFPRCCIQVRVNPDGTLDLAGWAERRACDFGREFTALVEKLSYSAESGQGDAD